MWNAPQVTTLEPFAAALEAYSIESETRHKVTYMVTLAITQEWTCSCPHWMYRRPGECKHIEWVKEWRIKQVNVPLAILPEKVNRFSVMDV